MARISRNELASAVKTATRAIAPPKTGPKGLEAPKPVDVVEARTGGTDGKAFVGAALKDIAARTARGEKVRVAFDIDDTLADTRVRTLSIAKAWDQANGTHFFDRLTLAQVGHNGLDTAKALGLPWAAEKAFSEHWETAFWDGANFVHDAPIPAVIAIAKAAKAAGAEVVFLTGRIQDREPYTIAQLRGFGLDANEDTVVSKPDLRTRTVPFKAEWLAASAKQGFHVSFFFTESRRDIAGVQAKEGTCTSVLLDSPFGGTEGLRADTPIYPRAV